MKKIKERCKQAEISRNCVGLSCTLLYAIFLLTTHCWGVKAMVDMECVLAHHFIHIGDKDAAMVDLAILYEKMMMRSHTNGGYVNSLMNAENVRKV